MQEVKNLDLQLLLVVVDAVLVLLERYICEGCLERRVVDNAVHVVEMLLESACDRAGLGCKLGVDEVVAALKSSLKK